MLTRLGPLAVSVALAGGCSSAPALTAAGGSPARASSTTTTIPSVTVRPNSDLHPGQQVTVVVDGFTAERKVFFSECLNRKAASSLGCGEQLAGQLFTITDARGHGTIRFIVTATAASGYLSGPRTCQGHCVLVATGGDGSAFATASLRLAPLGDRHGAGSGDRSR